jgi:hypothetical protein
MVSSFIFAYLAGFALDAHLYGSALTNSLLSLIYIYLAKTYWEIR